MKTLIFLSLISTALLLGSCTPQANVEALLKDAQTKDQIFSAIVADHDLMNDFMSKMMGNEHAMMMMRGNSEMMNMMMGEEKMMSMMKQNPEMMKNMMGGMMKDGRMMGQMLQMMHEKGMMSQECMQSCMQMMADKGMNMNTMMGENTMDKGPNDHQSHHE